MSDEGKRFTGKRWWKSNLAQEVAVWCWFLLLTVLIFWPILAHFDTYILGLRESDNVRATGDYLRLSYAFAHNLTPYYLDRLVRYPLGDWSYVSVANYPRLLYFHAAMHLNLNLIVVRNIWTLHYSLVAGLAMYYLVKHITGNRLAALIAGSIYIGAPGHLSISFSHNGSSSINYLILYLLSLLYYAEKPHWKRALLAGAVLGFIALDNPYYAYFVALFSVLFVCAWLIYKTVVLGWRKPEFRQMLGQLALIAVLGGIITTPRYLPVIGSIALGENFAEQQRSFPVEVLGRAEGVTADYLFLWAAYPWDYMLPSVYHPVFGEQGLGLKERANDFIAKRMMSVKDPDQEDFLALSPLNTYWRALRGRAANPNERQLYLGLTNVALALFGVWAWRKEPRLVKKRDLGVVVLLASTWFAIWTSLSSRITSTMVEYFLGIDFPLGGGTTWTTPSFFLVKLLPYFRVYSRVGLIAVFSVVALGGVGTAYLLERVTGRLVRAAITLGLLAFGMFEFLTPINYANMADEQLRYPYIERQPGDFAIFDDALAAGQPSGTTIVAQRFHQKPLLEQTWWDNVVNSDLSDQEKMRVLSGLGVRYVVLHEEITDTPPFDGLEQVDETPTAAIYEVQAEPVFVIVYKRREPGLNGVWESQNSWTITGGHGDFYIFTDVKAELCVRVDEPQTGAPQAITVSADDGMPSQRSVLRIPDGLVLRLPWLEPGVHSIHLDTGSQGDTSLTLNGLLVDDCANFHLPLE
jgi:hypothetical protein